VDAAWITPPVVLATGAAVAAVLARKVQEAAEQARAAGRRFRRLEDGLIPIRVESRRARANVDRMRRQ
jgi:hypothetical protein